MASIKNLKKNIEYTFGNILDICTLSAQLNPEADGGKAEAIVEEVFETFDGLIAKINVKKVENKKAHFKAISAELEEKANALIDKVNNL